MLRNAHRSKLGCGAQVPSWRPTPLAPPSSLRFEDRKPVIQASAPFLLSCASVVRGDIFDTGLFTLLLVLFPPLIHALPIVGHAVGVPLSLVFMCCVDMWPHNTPSRSFSDLCLLFPSLCGGAYVVAMVWSPSRSILYEFLGLSIPRYFPYIA